MSANSAAIGPLMEQLVQLVSDNENNKRQLAALLEGIKHGIESALAVVAPPKRQRRVKTAEELPDGSMLVPESTRVSTKGRHFRVKPYVRGPYKPSKLVHAAASVNARIRHLHKTDPLRVKVEAIREKKGHDAAKKYLDKKMPVGRPHQVKGIDQREKKRARDRNRLRFNSALVRLPNAERLAAQSIQREKGYEAALAWMNNGRGESSAVAAEA